MIYLFRYAPLLFFLTALTGCAKYTTVRRRADFNPHTLKQNNLIIIPSEAQVNVSNFISKNKRMEDYEYHLEGLINRTLTSVLQQNGYNVTMISPKESFEQNISGQVLNLREEYKLNIKSLYQKQTWTENKAHAITTNVGLHSITQGKENANKKYVVICDYDLITQDNSARSVNFALSLLDSYAQQPPAETSMMRIGIVEQSTGNLVWSNAYFHEESVYSCALKKMRYSDAEIDEKHILSMVNKVLEPITRQ